MTDTTMEDGTFKLTGRHVLVTLIAFFGVIFAVNGYFLYSALSTYTGVVAQEPYRKGLHYNERIAADEVQQSRGWAVALDVAKARTGLVLDVKHPDGKPVTDLALTGFIGRPSTTGYDKPLTLREVAPGRYGAEFPKLDDGNWVLSLTGQIPDAKSGEPPFRLKKRLWLTP